MCTGPVTGPGHTRVDEALLIPKGDTLSPMVGSRGSTGNNDHSTVGKRSGQGHHRALQDPGKGPGLEQVCLRPTGNVWVLDFVQERFHNMRPEDFERTFTRASETRKGLGQKKQQERA